MQSYKFSRCFFPFLLLCTLAMMRPYAYALDAPHTNTPGYGIECGSCHWTNSSSSPPWSTIQSAPDPADDTINNRRCYACHDGSKSDIPGAKTHSSSTTSNAYWTTLQGWKTECITCHDPHQQRQTRAWGALTYLAKGSPPVTIGNWETGNRTQIKVAETLTKNYYGNYFLPDTNYPFFYQITTDTTNSRTFEVKGQVLTAYVKSGGYAIVYGKNVKDYINYTNPGGTAVGGMVKLGGNSGTNGPGDSLSASTSVCYVCHTQTMHWSSVSGDTGHNDRSRCLGCHAHLQGLRAVCDGCHGAPPSTGAHVTHFGGLTSEASYGNDEKIINDPQKYKFNCGNCHPLDGARHADGTIDVELYNACATGFKMNNPASASKTGTGTSTVCNNVYCHSNGAGEANRVYRTTPQWGGVFLNNKCVGCHDDPPQYAGQSHYTPDGFMGREGSHLVGIHFDNIHSGTSGLLPPGGPEGAGAAHGDPSTSTTMSCNTCHAVTMTAANQQSADGTPFACGTCHGMPAAVSIADKTMHVNGSRDVEFMSGTLKSKAQLSDDAFAKVLQPLGWTRNNGYKLGPDSHDSVDFSGSYDANTKTCVTACHLNQPARWGDTNITCVSCHTDI